MKKTSLPSLLLSLGLLSVFPLLALPALAADPVAQSQEPTPAPVDDRFGVVESFWGPDEAAELNVGWDRILFYWNEIQPTGPDDWNTLHVLEEWLTDARAHDRRVMGLLKNTPVWATDGPPYSGVPRGLYLPIDDPDNLWAAYIGKVVDYYAPLGVHDWIVWNEPEIDPGVYGHEFDGTVQDYYQLLKVTYQVAKARDPEAVIHLAGYSYWHDPNYLRRLLGVIAADPEAADNNFFFDALSLHIYFRVETVEELVEEAYAALRNYGMDQPVWINETNASPNLDPLWPVERPQFQVDLDQQAWYLVQAYALGFGAEAESIGVYKLIDVQLPPGGESFGIVRPDFSRRPAFYAFQKLVERLGGFVPPVQRQQTADYYAFTFDRPGDITRVLWSRVPSVLTLQAPALAGTEAELYSATGESLGTLRAEDGLYELRLEGARCDEACDIGGPPVFLVEQRDEPLPPTSTPSPTKTATLTPAATRASAGTATATRASTRATAEATATKAMPTATRYPTIAAAAVLTGTLTPVPTATATLSVTLTPTPTATWTPSPTASPTPSPTETATPSPTTTLTPVPTHTATPTPAPVERAGETAAGILQSAGSWLILGAAVVLGGLLVARALRNR